VGPQDRHPAGVGVHLDLDRDRALVPVHRGVAPHDAYYRVTHRPAMTYTSCGPGSLNRAMAVANAYYDSSAFLAITGNVPTTQFNRGPFQETGRQFQGDFNNVMRPYVKRTYQAFRPEMIPLTVSQAYAQMVSGRPRCCSRRSAR